MSRAAAAIAMVMMVGRAAMTFPTVGKNDDIETIAERASGRCGRTPWPRVQCPHAAKINHV